MLEEEMRGRIEENSELQKFWSRGPWDEVYLHLLSSVLLYAKKLKTWNANFPPLMMLKDINMAQ